ncbi:cation channel sperm-associated auxiliary subunit gamma [Petaurus breviceps papuanus]|uniref:cation channel sperm-associated auxiliary subunit gamma n=1 Tax=Petaurus breviceps papuanus TaxID=3040969 RepID=UPI0036DF5E35
MASLLLLLLLLLLLPPPPVQLWPQLEDACTWQVVLNKYSTLGKDSEKFFDQAPVSDVEKFFNKLEDSPIDHTQMYFGFPYFLKINLRCPGLNSEVLMRSNHFKGLFPRVLVTFYSLVNFEYSRIERLQINMEGAPFQTHKTCHEEEICLPSWYTPMPMKNGSIVMQVDIFSNNQGEPIRNARYIINVNGYLKKEKEKLIFTMGSEVRAMTHRDFINVPSRPVWATVGQAPVLILGGIPDEKMILFSDSSFKDISLVELNIDSCWLGSLHCPQDKFTASIFDTISTESVLFIRQNQLVYYFTGNYSHIPGQASTNWEQVLKKRCIKRLCPVEQPGSGSEYVLALAGGKEEGYFHFGNITDGKVTFKQLPVSSSICESLRDPKCKILWVLYNDETQHFWLLMESGKDNKKAFNVLEYTLPEDYNQDSFHLLYKIPRFVPKDEGKNFVMLLGMEEYTDHPLVPKGLFHNTFSNLFIIWGNAILQSLDNTNFIYLNEFPYFSSIKYMAASYKGQLIAVTETEEIWFMFEGSFKVYRLYPSDGWDVLFSLSQMQASSLYSTNETSVSIFYDRIGLQQLVYLVDKKGEGKLVKRLVPVYQILVYQMMGQNTFEVQMKLDGNIISFSEQCPFKRLKLIDLLKPQQFTRIERYSTKAPFVSNEFGFHTKISLAIYQGLVHHLLYLHDKYDKPYADPVHDPTWRWWKEEKEFQDYFFYKASNFKTTYGIHIEMTSYGKIYDLGAQNRLPDIIFLDKGTSYRFIVYIISQKSDEKGGQAYGNSKGKDNLHMAVILADPSCISVTVNEKMYINKGSSVFTVTIQDKRYCFNQSISGQNLIKTALTVKMSDSIGKCFRRTRHGYRLLGYAMIPMYIGCPPGKRLAFDVTSTLRYNKETNKRYFDCVHPDPEMPCFLFSDPFMPFFLIQDMVTGESGSFNGSYVLKVIGGGTSLEEIVDYSEADIFRYNSPKDNTNSLIWTARENWMDSNSFSILQHNSSGIEWLCLKNSPCHDIVPTSIFSPDFFFKIMVSNRGVDTSTYCDYQLIFILHLHGLPLSTGRARFFLWVSLCATLGSIFLFLLSCFLWPRLKRCWMLIKMKFTNLITTESFYTYTTSATTVPSMVSSRMSAADRLSIRKSKSKKSN